MGQTVQWTQKREARMKQLVNQIVTGYPPLTLDDHMEYVALRQVRSYAGPRDWIDKCADRAQKKKVREAVEKIKAERAGQ